MPGATALRRLSSADLLQEPIASPLPTLTVALLPAAILSLSLLLPSLLFAAERMFPASAETTVQLLYLLPVELKPAEDIALHGAMAPAPHPLAAYLPETTASLLPT